MAVSEGILKLNSPNGKTLGHRQSDPQNVSGYLSAMRRKQRFTGTILHDLRSRAGANRLTSTTTSTTTSISIRDAARPSILPIPASAKRLGGRPNKQDKQQPNRLAPTRHRRPDLVDTVRRRPCLRLLLVFRWRKLILHPHTVQHHFRHRRSNLRTLRSPPHILPPKKSRSNTTLDSLRDLDSSGFH